MPEERKKTIPKKEKIADLEDLFEDVSPAQEGQTQESVATPEQEPQIESVPEKQVIEKDFEDQPQDQVSQVAQQKAPQAEVTPERGIYYDRVESILEEGLAEMYAGMPDNIKPAFKQRGEQTVTQIDTLLHSTKVKIKEIIQLILEWLRMIPGVNRFFIEKEASIKAKKIIKLKK